MPKRLTEAEIARFREDGLLFPLRALPETEIAERRAALEALEAARAGRIPPTLNAKIHLLLPWAWSLVHAPAIVDPVEDLLGPDILCWGSSLFIKDAGQQEIAVVVEMKVTLCINRVFFLPFIKRDVKPAV